HREEPRRAPRIAVVRCETVSEVCPGVGCLQAVQAKHAHFAGYAEGVELVGFFTCGGCPGRRVGRLVERLLDFGLDAVHLSSCVMLEGEYPRCPHREQMARTIEARGVRVVKGTHH
ncbi:MAG: CGGC domain-containing protein, partial [Syntrophomonadaceae bacterium]|nr:CGGC domain-containing protein [Syntrophomonadaceae bacterium]